MREEFKCPILHFLPPPKSLCILRLSAVGDVCHALAVVQHIQRHWPQTKLTWIVGKTEMGLLSGIEGVELVPYDKRAVGKVCGIYGCF